MFPVWCLVTRSPVLQPTPRPARSAPKPVLAPQYSPGRRSAVLHRDVSAAPVLGGGGEARHVLVLALGAQPASRAGAAARGGITGAAVVALTFLLAPWTVLSRRAFEGTLGSSKARWT